MTLSLRPGQLSDLGLTGLAGLLSSPARRQPAPPYLLGTVLFLPRPPARSPFCPSSFFSALARPARGFGWRPCPCPLFWEPPGLLYLCIRRRWFMWRLFTEAGDPPSQLAHRPHFTEETPRPRGGLRSQGRVRRSGPGRPAQAPRSRPPDRAWGFGGWGSAYPVRREPRRQARRTPDRAESSSVRCHQIPHPRGQGSCDRLPGSQGKLRLERKVAGQGLSAPVPWDLPPARRSASRSMTSGQGAQAWELRGPVAPGELPPACELSLKKKKPKNRKRSPVGS